MEKKDNFYQAILFKKFMMHTLFIIKLKKKNFFITSFFVLRLVNFHLLKN